MNANSIITNASQILNRLAEQNITVTSSLDNEIYNYINAKYAFISIAETCLQEEQPLATHFETELRNRHSRSEISSQTFTILWWHLDTILAYYQQCSKESTLKEKVLSQAALATEIDCAICLTPHKRQDTLCIQSCQHEFGKVCLLEWQHVSKQCPLCRSDAKKIYGYKGKT
jgi:hypothetical protein